MKPTFTILFLTFTIFVYSQTPLKFIVDNTNDVRSLSDSIALRARGTYVFSKQGVEETNGYEVLYKNKADSTDIMHVRFILRMSGANKDLEISGTPQYIFSNVSGKYLDLFPFWKTFINPSDNIEELSKKGLTYCRIGNNRLMFNRSSKDKWMLSLK